MSTTARAIPTSPAEFLAGRTGSACVMSWWMADQPDPGPRPHQLGLPLKPGKAGNHDSQLYPARHHDPFAALNVLDGTVLGRRIQRHRHQEFIRFLNTVEAAVPAGKLVHSILDTDSVQPIRATPKHPKVRAWLERHGRWTFHYTPTFGSWLNTVETFFSAMIRRGVFRSLVDLQAAIHGYLAEHNADLRPFVWTATPEHVLAKLESLNASLH